MAERNLFHVVSKMLWAFDIEMATDERTGEPIVPDSSIETGYREGLTLCVNEFPISLKVRSTARRNAVDEGFKAASRDVFEKYDDTDLTTV